MLYNDLEDGFVQTSLGAIHYKQHEGGGKKIVFLHGIGASVKAFARLVEQLPDNLSIYLIDLLGHGDSDAPRIDYSIDIEVRVVQEFLENKKIQDNYLFGHSYGGWIAAKIAQDSYKGNGIVLEDSAGLVEDFDENYKSDPEHVGKFIKELLAMNARENVVRSMIDSRSKEDYLSKESLGNIVKPCLIVWGSEDPTVNVKYAKLFNEYVKGSVLEIVPGAGHLPHYTHAKRVADVLLKFISYGRD